VTGQTQKKCFVWKICNKGSKKDAFMRLRNLERALSQKSEFISIKFFFKKNEIIIPVVIL